MLICGLLELVSRSARAETSNIYWKGPDCRDSQPAFEARLSALAEPRDRARLFGLVGMWQRDGKVAVSMRLSVSGGPGLGGRSFEAPSCKAAAETAAVAVAMAAFSPESDADESEPGNPAEQPSSANLSAWALKPDPAPDFFRERVRRRPPRASPQVRTGLLATFQAGVLPQPSLGVAVELGLGFAERWSAALLGGVGLEQERVLEAERRIFLRVLSGVLRGCYAPVALQSSRLSVCTGAQLFWIRGHGSGFDISRSASLVALAPLLAFDFSVNFPKLVEWHAELEGSAPLSRQRFLVDDEEVARSEATILSLRFGPVVRF
jgi:hypothetical protein